MLNPEEALTDLNLHAKNSKSKNVELLCKPSDGNHRRFIWNDSLDMKSNSKTGTFPVPLEDAHSLQSETFCPPAKNKSTDKL